jgi:hypothetical protein
MERTTTTLPVRLISSRSPRWKPGTSFSHSFAALDSVLGFERDLNKKFFSRPEICIRNNAAAMPCAFTARLIRKLITKP